MKKKVFIIGIFLLSFFIISCEKEEVITIDPFSLQVKLNGEYWTPNSFNALIDRDNKNSIFIVGVVRDEFGYIIENLGIYNIPLELGSYAISKTSDNHFASYNTSYGDVLDDYYQILEGEENYLEITSINMDSMKVGGNFQLTFIRENILPPTIPDTLRFTEGDFITNLYKPPYPDPK